MPSTLSWTGAAKTVTAVRPFTVAGASDTTTYKLTGGNGKVVSYTALAGDSSAVIATALAAAWTASTEGEHAEVTAAAVGAVVTLTGPSDGRPFTATASVSGGSGTLTAGTATVGSSPNHLSAAGNYSGGAVPATGDTVVFDSGSVPVKWDLDDWTTRTVTVTFVRRSTYKGTVGLPDRSPAGYVEYRPRFLETAGTAPLYQQADSDAAGAFRLKSTAGSAVTLVAVGNGATRGVGSEPLEVTGLPASSVLDVTGCAVAVSPTQGQTSAVATLLASANSAVRLGPGVTFGTGTFTGSGGLVYCTYTAVTGDRGANVTFAGAAGGTTTTFFSGTAKWMSTGSPGAVVLGAAGVFDCALAPKVFSVTSLTGDKGAKFADPAGRITKGFTLVARNCGYTDLACDFGTHLSTVVSAGP